MERYSLFYFLPHFAPILALCGYLLNMPYLFFAGFIFFITLVVTLDFFVERDPSYSYEEVLTTVENDGRLSPWIFEFSTASYFILYLFFLGFALYYVQYEQPFWAWFLYAIPLGYSAGTVINLAHEYVHKNNLIEKNIGRFLLSFFMFNVFEYDHLYNHHNDDITCTDKDPAFARLNQSVYAYTWQLYRDHFKNSIDLQNEISRKLGASPYNIFKNTLLFWTLISATIPVLIAFFIGWKALALFFVQLIISLIMFSGATYNQHYGLGRRVRSDGTIEHFTFMNVWSSNHFMTGKLYINLSHHGHHHLFNLCRYPHLKILRLGPLLPYGYNASFALSFIPSLWYKVMNPLVERVFVFRDQYEKEGKL
jgi:alkane 1-monooxygenase